LLDALHGPGAGFTIACPAFPENQRTVFKGHLFVGDQLLSDSGMRHHPLTPMTDATWCALLQSSRGASRAGRTDVVAQGPQPIRARFAALQAKGVQIAVLDAISNDDLLRIGVALAGMPLVTAARASRSALPQNWRASDELASGTGPTHCRPLPACRRWCSGSCSLAPNAQVPLPRSRLPAW